MRILRMAAALALLAAAIALPASAFNYDLSFWLSRSPGSTDVLADAAGIKQLRLSIEKAGAGVVDLLAHPADIDAFALTEYLKPPQLPSELYTSDGAAAPSGAISQITSKVKPEGVSAWAKVRYGISVVKADLRALPSSERLFDKRTGGVDVLQAGRLLPGEPVVVLYETSDRSWFFVQTARQRGWVAGVQIAVALTREHWASYVGSADFIVVTAPALYIDQDGSPAPFELPMGTRLPVVPANSVPEVVKSRGAYDSYVVLLPVRRTDGKLNVTPALVPRTADVSEGYLALTGENISRQAMKLVGTKYGGKGHLGRDAYLLVSDVFRCMGVEMPVSAAGYSALTFVKTDVKGLQPDLKILSFRKAMAGSVLMLEGGPSIFLGQYGEDVYAVAALATVRMPSKSKTSYELLDMPFNGVGLISLKSIYSATGNDYFTEAIYIMHPAMK